MAFRCCMAAFVYWILFLVLSVQRLPSCSSFPATATPRRCKAAQKALDKFQCWTKQSSETNSRILWVDGNNVRGIGKFEWNAVELQHKVVQFCHQHQIETAIVVWDHGSLPFASSKRYSLENTDGKESFAVDLLVLFSGLSQRADDVLVKESNHLTSKFQHGSTTTTTTTTSNVNWGSLAFVTNDRDLTYKLRKRAIPNPPSIRLSRRKRRGKVYDSSAAVSSSQESNTKANPLFCDSTGFVELLGDYNVELSETEAKASESIEAQKASIRECSKSQRRGYNPRREKTWERCVQAETLRRMLDAGSLNSEPVESSFAAAYLQELHSTRGYSIAGAEKNNEFLPFLGPSRLDKHQRRLLARFNALARNGEIS